MSTTGKNITNNNDCFIITNAGCFVLSFVHVCTIVIRIDKIKIAEYLSQDLKIQPFTLLEDSFIKKPIDIDFRIKNNIDIKFTIHEKLIIKDIKIRKN